MHSSLIKLGQVMKGQSEILPTGIGERESWEPACKVTSLRFDVDVL